MTRDSGQRSQQLGARGGWMADLAQTAVERRELILRLLAHRHDHLPVPGRRDHAASGFVHHVDALESCPDCFGETPGRVGCETCRGAGTVRVRRDRDPYAVSGPVQPYGMTGTQHERTRALDAAIDRAAQLARDRPVSELDTIAEAGRRDYGWVVARERMFRDFDFGPLEVGLERLRFALPDIPPGSERGLRFLDSHMPRVIRAPGPEPAVRTEPMLAPRERNRRIRELVVRDGMPSQWVAWHVGLSVSQVNRIVNRQEEAA